MSARPPTRSAARAEITSIVMIGVVLNPIGWRISGGCQSWAKENSTPSITINVPSAAVDRASAPILSAQKRGQTTAPRIR